MKTKIQDMKLYNSIKRANNELQLLEDQKKEIDVYSLAHFDQLHYNGLNAIDNFISEFRINENSKILEIGSGIGGPSRYISYKTGAKVTALELQPELNEIAIKLTNKCKLQDQVIHLCGDFLEHDFESEKFDYIVSWLALYHIPNRQYLLNKSHNLLKKNGVFFAEDFFCYKEFNEKEKTELKKDFYANYIVTKSKYISDFKENGFSELRVQDMTEDWKNFVCNRLKNFKNNLDMHLEINDASVVNDLLFFYEFVKRYFNKGSLAGIKIYGFKR